MPAQTPARDSAQQSKPPSLLPLLGERWAWRWPALIAVGLLSCCWLWFSFMPLAAGELWGQLAGRTQFPLLEGVPSGPELPASRLLYQTVVTHFGYKGLASLQAVLAMSSLLILFAACYRIHRQPLLAAASIVVITAAWTLVSAEMQAASLGALAFAVLLFIVSDPAELRSRGKLLGELVVVALAMALWANASSTFIIGVLLLIGVSRGAGIVAFLQKRSLKTIWADARLRRTVYLLEAGLLGVLCNARGIDVFLDAKYLDWIWSPYATRTWQPLTINSPAGIMLAVLLLLSLGLFRLSRGKLNPELVLGWVILLLLTCLDRAALLWSVPLTILVLQPLLAERLQVGFPKKETSAKAEPHTLTAADFRLTMISLLIIWVAFTFSPLGSRLLGGKPRTTAQIVSRSLPVRLSEFLRTSPRTGQLVHPAVWGEWLAHSGPGDLQLFLGLSELDRAPVTLFNDQNRILNATEGWEKTSEKYRINTIVLPVETPDEVLKKFTETGEWQKTYSDELAIMYQRAAMIEAMSAGEGAKP